MKVPDRDLWRAWRRRRDARAFERIVLPEVRHAAALARRMGATGAEAEDLVQQSLLRLARERSDDPVRFGVRAWLCRRVVLGFRMHVRAAVRRRRYERAAPTRTAVADPTRSIEMRDQVEKVLGQLDDAERDAVHLRYLNDLDYAEIAYVLGISENACRLRVHKGIRRLRQRYGRKVGAILGALTVPALSAEAGLVSAAVAAAPAATFGTGLWTTVAGKAAAVVLAAGAVTAGLLVLPGETEAVSVPSVAAVLPPLPTPMIPEEKIPAPEPELRVVPAFEFLEDHLAGRKDATKTLWEFERVAKLVEAPDGDWVGVRSTGEVTEVDLTKLLRSGDRIRLGSGRFKVTKGIRRNRTRPVLIRGAGKDRTVLYTDSPDVSNARDDLEGLFVRDLTFEGTGEDLRRGGLLLGVEGRAAAVFEGVRFRDWVDTAGFGAPVGVNGRALLAFRDCEFVGGYRRRSYKGFALSDRGRTLAIFENCRFFDLAGALNGSGSRETTAEARPKRSLVHFRNCRFENSRVTDSRITEGGIPVVPIRVRNANISFGLDRDPQEVRLERWGLPYLDHAEGLSLRPGVPRITLASLLRVLATVSVEEGERVVGVEALVWTGAPVVRYAVHVAGPGGEPGKRVVELGPKGARPAEPRGWTVPRHPWSFRLGAGEPDLTAMLEAAPVPDPRQPCHGIWVTRYTGGSLLVLSHRFGRNSQLLLRDPR